MNDSFQMNDGDDKIAQEFTAASTATSSAVTLLVWFVDPGTTVGVRLFRAADMSAAGPTYPTSVTPLASASASGGGYGYVVMPLDTSMELTKGTAYVLVVDRIAGGRAAVGLAPKDADAISPWYSYGSYGMQLTSFEMGMSLDGVGAVPAVDVSVTGTTGDAGWFTSAVDAEYTCLAEVLDCPADASLTTTGTHALAGTFYTGPNHQAANHWTHQLKVDLADPVVTHTVVAPDPSADDRGYVVEWECADEGSGLSSACPASTYVSGVGSDTTATLTATDVAGRSATSTVTGLVATAKTVTAPPTPTTTTPKPKPVPSAPTRAKPKTVISITAVGATRTRGGHPVVRAGESYKVRVSVKRDGKYVTGRPVWLHSVTTNKSGTKGKPTRVFSKFVKSGQHSWVKTHTLSPDWAGQYRKFGVRMPNGTVRSFTIYVK